MKKVLFVLMLLIPLVFAFSAAAFADEGFPDASADPALKLRVGLFDAADAYADVLELPGYPEAPYYLFLPANCSRNELRLIFQDAWMTVNGASVHSGDSTDVFLNDGTYTVKTPQGTFPLRVVSSVALPSLYISTESGSLSNIHADKSYKEAGVLTAVDNGAVQLDRAELTYIKGRGNTSWRSNEKRSYNIKFEEKTGLFGMKKAKKWVLTSNNTDASLMRNAIMYTAAKYTSLPYTVDFVFVDLYINGNYRGNYLLCEKIEVGDNRIAITDLEKENKLQNPGLTLAEAPRLQEKQNGVLFSWADIPNDPSDITGGYLLEYEYPDQFETEPCSFITKSGQCLIVHSPEYATKNEMLYISSLYAEFEEALLSDDGRNTAGRHFSDYIDWDSFVDALLLYEFSEDLDYGHTSWYLFVPAGENKFYMGPVWDFDSGMDTADAPLRCVSILAQREFRGIDSIEEKTFLNLLSARNSMVESMSQRFPTLATAFNSSLNNRVNALFEKIEPSAAADRLRWGYRLEQRDLILGDYVSERTKNMSAAFSGFQSQVEQLLKEMQKQKRKDIFIVAAITVPLTAAGIAVALRVVRNKKQRTQK